MHFFEHFTFGETDWSKRGKRLEKYVKVVIAIELVTVGTKLEEYEMISDRRRRYASMLAGKENISCRVREQRLSS